MTRVSLQQWQQAKEIFTEALQLSGSAQKEFLDRACGEDIALRNEVESLLNSYQHAASFMEVPAVESAAESLLNETSQLEPGQRIKHYEIVEQIGEGGMGEVYLARDTILGRRVALKFLPGYLRSDPDRLRRFQQEARAASTLSHPNVCVIHEVGETDDGHPFITMEYIEGTTLRERMSSGSIAVNEALEISVQVAEALSAAHEAGIVHRDIKPENIMIRKDGYVKVLDFGLAKLTEHRKPAKGMTMSTLLMQSSPGAVMGTAAYMSPEQARGVDVDARTDVWSLGVVIYEMIAGEPPFVGETPTDVVVAIVDREPAAIAEHLEDVPDELERIVRKALRKDQTLRYQFVKELAIDLRALQKDLEIDRSNAPRPREIGPRQAGAQKTRAAFAATNRLQSLGVDRSKSLSLIAIAIAVLAVIGITSFGLYKWKAAKSSAVVGRFQRINVTKLTTNGSAIYAAISPDGKYVSYIKSEGGKESLWLRQISTTANVEIISAKEGHYSGIMFAPDGNFIYYAYAAPTDEVWQIYKVPTLGVGATPLRVNTEEGPASISRDGKRMAFVRFNRTKRADFLKIANIDGSNEQILTTHSKPESLCYDISATPAWTNNDQTLTLAMVNNDTAGFYFSLYEIDVNTHAEKTIPLAPLRFEQPSRITLLPDGNGIVTSGKVQGASFAQVWLLGRDGSARSLTNDLSDYRDVGVTDDAAALVTIQNQTLANLFVVQNNDVRNQKQITFGLGRYFDLNWTPDNKIVYASDASGSADIFEINADGTGARQLTSGAKRNYAPSVSPDNRYIVFHSNRSGTFQIWRTDRDGSNPVQLTNTTPECNWPTFSPDSKSVFYQHFEPGNSVSLWKVSVDGGTPSRVSPPGTALRPVVSPDGKWLGFWQNDGDANSKWRLAVMSLETEKIVNRFDVSPTIHVQWDTQLRWAPDSRGLVYVDTRAGVQNLWVQLIDGSPAKQLTSFNEIDIFAYEWSRTGTLVISRGVITGDVVLIADAGK